VPPRPPSKADPFEREIEAALQPGRFVRHAGVWSFVEGLGRIEARIARFVRGSPARAAVLYETFLAGCYQKAEEVDGSSGDFGMFVDGLFRGWVKARQADGADPDETARRLCAWMDDDPYGFCYQLERGLVKALDKRGLAAFERCVRERFDGTAAAPPLAGAERDRAYARRRAAEILRAILAEQRNVEAYLALAEATELTPADCLALARMLRSRRKPAEALTWVERGLALDRKSQSSADHDLGALRRDLLVELGRGDAALEAAWTDFKAQPSKYSYADLLRYVPRAERVAWHQKAMEAAAGGELQSLIELWLETKEIDRLVERLRRARDEELERISHYVTEPVAKRLAKTHPDIAAKVYRALGMRILEAKKSRYYEAALSNFEDARRCYERAGLAPRWEALVGEIRAQHHRKVGFMAGFEEVVAGGGPSARPTFLERAKARWKAPSGTGSGG
jgi:tetratricopeptide (TPR) repeat protein